MYVEFWWFHDLHRKHFTAENNFLLFYLICISAMLYTEKIW